MNKIIFPVVTSPKISEIVNLSEIEPTNPRVKKIVSELRHKKNELKKQKFDESALFEGPLKNIKNKYDRDITAINSILRVIAGGVKKYKEDQRRAIKETVLSLDLTIPKPISIPTHKLSVPVPIPGVDNTPHKRYNKPTIPKLKTQTKPILKHVAPTKKFRVTVVDMEAFIRFCIRKKDESGISYMGFIKVDTKQIETTFEKFTFKSPMDGIKYEYVDAVS
jgi:hypothetical protein